MNIELTFLLILVVFSMEILVFKKRIVVLSPVMMLMASLMAMYVLPYYLSSFSGGWTRIESLTNDEIAAVVNRLNVFLVVWLLIATPLLRRVARTAAREGCSEAHVAYVPGRQALYVVLTAYSAIYLVYIGSGVSFNPAAMVDRMVNPRAYTFIKAGFGPLIYVKTGLGFALIVMAAVRWRAAPAKAERILILTLALALNVLGGAKSSLVMPFVALVLVMQRTQAASSQRLVTKFGYMLVAPVIAASLLMAAFSLWGKQTEATGFERVVTQLREYGREAYLSARVVADFPWSPRYTEDALMDTLTAPMPRVIFPDKEFVGFYKRYWMPMYEPGVVQYHTTTAGFIAEGQMVFGALSPFFYGILFAFLCAKVYAILLSPKSLPALAVAIFITAQMYFIARTGAFGTTFWFISIPALFIWGAYVLTRQRYPKKITPSFGQVVVS